MNLPRALRGPVWCIGRPARPIGEAAAVRAAARALRVEAGDRSDNRAAKEIAKLVVKRLLLELEPAPDPFVTALADLEQRYAPSPIVTLATCPEINTASEFIRRRVAALVSGSGRYLTPAEQQAEKKAIAADMMKTLARRYCLHLRR